MSNWLCLFSFLQLKVQHETKVLTAWSHRKIKKMAEPDKLNIDSIIQRLLEGEKGPHPWLTYVSHAARWAYEILVDDGSVQF